jgi:ABC-type polysaccharide/polyol phosphate export permease
MAEARPHAFVELTLARVREYLRQPSILFWSFGFPVMLSVALGLAFRRGGQERIAVGIVDGERAARDAAVLGGAGLDVRRLAPDEVRAALRSGRVALVVAPEARPVYRYDATRPESRLGRQLVDDALERDAGRRDALEPRDEQVVEVGSRYIDFLIPGMIGMNVMGGSMWGIGWVLVDMRVRRLLKRLRATPMSRRDFLLTHGVMRLAVVGLELAVMLGFGYLAFGVRVAGSLAVMGVVTCVGAMSFAGVATLVASRAETTQGATGLLNLFMVPMWVLSGVFFSAARFPHAIQPVIRVLPLTALNDALRAVMIDGRSLVGVAPQLAVLAVWGVASFALGLRFFKWR